MIREDVLRRFVVCVTSLLALAACVASEPAPVEPAPVGRVAPPAPPPPPAPRAAPAALSGPSDAATPAAPVEIPEMMRIKADRSRTVFLVGASDLIWPAKGPVDARIDLEGRTIWSGRIARADVAPEVLPIELDAPLPQTGTLHATVVVGDRTYMAETEARPGEFLEIRGGTRGPSLGWNPGYKYY